VGVFTAYLVPSDLKKKRRKSASFKQVINQNMLMTSNSWFSSLSYLYNKTKRVNCP
jgi:hypothetical protein